MPPSPPHPWLWEAQVGCTGGAFVRVRPELWNGPGPRHTEPTALHPAGCRGRHPALPGNLRWAAGAAGLPPRAASGCRRGRALPDPRWPSGFHPTPRLRRSGCVPDRPGLPPSSPAAGPPPEPEAPRPCRACGAPCAGPPLPELGPPRPWLRAVRPGPRSLLSPPHGPAQKASARPAFRAQAARGAGRRQGQGRPA